MLRRKRRVSKPWKRVLVAVAVSLALNVLLVREVKVGFLLAGKAEYRSVALAPLSASQWEANRALRGDARAAPPPSSAPAVAEPPPPDKVQAPGQVVDVAPSKDHTPPKSSRFVSDQNNSVDKETRSRHAKAGYANVLPKPSSPQAGAKPPTSPPVAEAGQGGKSGKGGGAVTRGLPQSSDGKVHVPDQKAREKLAFNYDPNGVLRSQTERQEIRGEGPGGKLSVPGTGALDGTGPGKGGKPGPVDLGKLMPSAVAYERIAGGPAPDHLDGVEEGEETALNTREWKYATYFNRIKQAVATQWDPNDALRQRDPTGRTYAYKDRLTMVTVTLDDHGALKNLSVEKTSGVDFLDSTALDAFRKAQPFVNPPATLVDANHEIHFSFGFYLEVGSPLRIFRAPLPGG